MQITRITVPVSIDEREALRILAQQEMRDPREQVRYLLQQELIKRGMLTLEMNSAGHVLADTSTVTEVNL